MFHCIQFWPFGHDYTMRIPKLDNLHSRILLDWSLWTTFAGRCSLEWWSLWLWSIVMIPSFIHCRIWYNKSSFISPKQLQHFILVRKRSKGGAYGEQNSIIYSCSCNMVDELPFDITMIAGISSTFTFRSSKMSWRTFLMLFTPTDEFERRANDEQTSIMDNCACNMMDELPFNVTMISGIIDEDSVSLLSTMGITI